MVPPTYLSRCQPSILLDHSFPDLRSSVHVPGLPSALQHLGAEVYATASRPKHEVVAARGVDPARIFDSRSTSWFDDLMAATDGR